MTVDTHLRRIDAAAAESLDVQTRAAARRRAGSRRVAYEKALREVERVAGPTEAALLADWICDRLRERRQFPAGRAVRKRGAEICRASGHPVSTGSHLGA